MSKKALRFTEEQYLEMLSKKNSGIPKGENKKNVPLEAVIQNTPLKSNDEFEISENEEDSDKKKKVMAINIKDLSLTIRNSQVEVSFNPEKKELIIILNGARLLSYNQITAAYQYRPYEVFNYKKAWSKKISEIFLEYQILKMLKDNNIELPLKNCEIEVFRQAGNLVDNDALPVMFKYFIDQLRYANLLSEDDPTVVKDIKGYQQIGTFCIGIKVRNMNCSARTAILNLQQFRG